jgi:hypothetical protein
MGGNRELHAITRATPSRRPELKYPASVDAFLPYFMVRFASHLIYPEKLICHLNTSRPVSIPHLRLPSTSDREKEKRERHESGWGYSGPMGSHLSYNYSQNCCRWSVLLHYLVFMVDFRSMFPLSTNLGFFRVVSGQAKGARFTNFSVCLCLSICHFPPFPLSYHQP